MAGKVNDMTDAFDRRLEAAERNRVDRTEVDAWIAVYERVRTAKAICESLLPAGYSGAEVVAVAGEIARLAQSGQVPRTRA